MGMTRPCPDGGVKSGAHRIRLGENDHLFRRTCAH